MKSVVSFIVKRIMPFYLLAASVVAVFTLYLFHASFVRPFIIGMLVVNIMSFAVWEMGVDKP